MELLLLEPFIIITEPLLLGPLLVEPLRAGHCTITTVVYLRIARLFYHHFHHFFVYVFQPSFAEDA